MCFNETWGTICNSQWTSNDADVVCKQLGWSRFGKLIISFSHSKLFVLFTSGALPSYYPVTPGTGVIHRGQFVCTGSESRLSDCRSGPATQCTHSDDAGVTCQNSQSVRHCSFQEDNGALSEYCQDGDLRLVDGGDELEGRIEMCYEELYGTICGSGFDLVAASVVCRQLGFSSPLGM